MDSLSDTLGEMLDFKQRSGIWLQRRANTLRARHSAADQSSAQSESNQLRELAARNRRRSYQPIGSGIQDSLLISTAVTVGNA